MRENRVLLITGALVNTLSHWNVVGAERLNRALFPGEPRNRRRASACTDTRDRIARYAHVTNRILVVDPRGKSGVNPALCRNGEWRRATSPITCLHPEP
jgi:hypothetical protein